MKKEKRSEFYSIVLLGKFNPALFHPYWFKERNLITESDVNTRNMYIHIDLAQVQVGEWMEIVVTRTRAEFKIRDAAKLPLLRDFVLDCLAVLPDSEITSLGVNHGEIDAIPDKNDYYLIGSILSPLSNWSDSMKEPKLQSICIEDEKSDLLTKKAIVIKAAPKEADINCININMNYHYDMPEGKRTTQDALRVLNDNIYPCYEDYEKVLSNFEQMVDNAN